MKLSALRPERWRYLRLIDIHEEVYKAASAKDAHLWWGVLWELSDYKGDFRATWSNEDAARRYHHLVDAAFARRDEGFQGVVHEWNDPDAPHGRSFFESPGAARGEPGSAL
jgi:hypothetical protein